MSAAENVHPKRVMLVDHNELEQSVSGLEEAEIVEIVDHHKIGNVGTRMPINFRNMPLGCTETVLYLMYKENNIEIPKTIAGLMMAGIISDTLLLTSPTTTDTDKKFLKRLLVLLVSITKSLLWICLRLVLLLKVSLLQM